MKVKFYDLALQNQVVKRKVFDKWQSIVEDNSFILGDLVTDFEKSFARYSEVQFCAGVANGTDAIEILLRASDLPQNSNVLIPANTFAATAFAILRAGHRVKLVDIEGDSMLMNLEAAVEKYQQKCHAIIPVHLYGQMVNVKHLINLTDGNALIIEDAAQSQGANLKGVKPGQLTFGAATSFYPGKNLGAFGDAGAVVTNSQETIEKVKAIRNYGSTRRYEHPGFGFNSRLDSLQAVVLSEKLNFLETWNLDRIRLAQRYLEELNGIESLELPSLKSEAHHVWHLFVVRTDNREEFMSYLLGKGVETSIHYPMPIHLHNAFNQLGYKKGDFPLSEKSANECVSLPLYPGMKDSEQEYVIDAIKKYFSKR